MPNGWTGLKFLEMALALSTLLAPGSVEVDSAYTREPKVKSSSSNQCEDLHLLHHVSGSKPVVALAWLVFELVLANIGAEDIEEIAKEILGCISIQSKILEIFYNLLVFRA